MNGLKDVVYIHHGILLSHKKEQNNAIYSDIDRTRDSHTKLSKKEKDKKKKKKRHTHPRVHCTTIHNSQDMETTQMSIDR